jgi:hypothetical protein
MNSTLKRVFNGARNYVRDNSIVVAIVSVMAFFGVMLYLVDAFWTQIHDLHVPRLVGYTIGWFIAMASTLAIALFLMWVSDRRDVDRSRRAIRLNFDHAITAMLELAKKFTASADRNDIGLAIESAQKQIIAASARLKRFENKLTAFPPVAMNAYGELENEIDNTLEDLNELHRKVRIDRESRFPKFGFELMDRLTRFDDYLSQIHSRETHASRAMKRYNLHHADQVVSAHEVEQPTNVIVRRA